MHASTRGTIRFHLQHAQVVTTGHWPTDPHAALATSLRKWQAIATWLRQGETVHDDGGAATCALCHLYTDVQCTGCPVAQRTGKSACRGTPYHRFYKDPHAAVTVAEQEVQFLYSLIRPTHTPRS